MSSWMLQHSLDGSPFLSETSGEEDSDNITICNSYIPSLVSIYNIEYIILENMIHIISRKLEFITS